MKNEGFRYCHGYAVYHHWFGDCVLFGVWKWGADMMDDLISRQAAIDVAKQHWYKPDIAKALEDLPSAQPERLTDDDFETIRIHLNAYKEKLCNQHRWKEAEEYQRIIDRFMGFASAQPEIIRCEDCIYYDPPHVENDGMRLEYADLPKEAFDVLGTGLVTLDYGINVGGRCTRDYNAGYNEDKRVFVPHDNFCGRAERRE